MLTARLDTVGGKTLAEQIRILSLLSFCQGPGKACLEASPQEEDILAGEGITAPEEVEELLKAEEEELDLPGDHKQDSIEEHEVRAKDFEVGVLGRFSMHWVCTYKTWGAESTRWG